MVDTTLHLDPELAKHRLGRDIMQKLEDMFGVPGVEGPGIEISQRLPLWPRRSATWTRKVYTASEEDPLSDNSNTGSQQPIPYQMLFFSVSILYWVKTTISKTLPQYRILRT